VAKGVEWQSCLTVGGWPDTLNNVNAVEFTTQLSGSNVLRIPSEVAAALPKSGKARIIVLTDQDADDAQWRMASYEQFMRNDPPVDADYDSCRS